MTRIRYAVVIEEGECNYSAYVPDMPGCVSVGDTLDEVKAEIREAIAFHLEGMRADGYLSPRHLVGSQIYISNKHKYFHKKSEAMIALIKNFSPKNSS